jgi:hypothetical protein
MNVAIEAVGGKPAGGSSVDLSVPAAPKAVAAPVAAAAPAAAVAPPAVAKAAPAVVVPAAKAAAEAAPAAAALPPPPAPIPYPALQSGVLSTQQIAERESQIKAIDKKNEAAMEAWKLQYGTAAKDRDRPLDLEQDKKKAEQAAVVAAEVEQLKDFALRRREADETVTIANIFRRLAQEPNAKDMFGIFNNEKISSGIATLAKEGVGIPGFSVGTKAIEDIMRNANLSEADQAKYRVFLTYAAMMQLQAQKYMKGSVSDNEQKLLANSGIGPQDTPQSIIMKADLLTLRAQFDRRVVKTFKNLEKNPKTKMTADDFLESKQYEDMRIEYNEKLSELAVGNKVLAPAPKAKAAGAVEPSPGFIFDPKLNMIRKKREGE